MRREQLALDSGALQRAIQWIFGISFESWPQQTRLADGLLRPSMVTDLEWESFGEVTAELVRAATPPAMSHLRERNRLLSAVMPGALIDPHTDELGADWQTRIHVPLLSNPDAMLISGDVVHRLAVGFAYEINTRERHAVWNAGATPRVHLMFDLHK
jgi:hypothetical protein